MASKKIKVYYYYPIIKLTGGNIRATDLEPILTQLKGMNRSERVLQLSDEDNIQLKNIKKTENNRWELGFLRNTKDTPFKSKLEDEVIEAEALEEDEFIGQECCMIYDEDTKIVSLQNNIRSISYKYLAQFFNNFIENRVDFIPITLKPQYSNISDIDEINYRNVVLSYLDISEINRLAIEENNKTVERIAKISKNLDAIQGKIELSVGRSKGRGLKKEDLKEIATFFKRYPKLTRGLKVKVIEDDNIRVVDLIQNKLYDEFNISISKNNRKNFEKILDPMNDFLDSALESSLQYCIKIIE